MKFKVLAISLVSIAVIGIGIALYLFNKKVPGLESAKPDFEMTSNDLFDAFDMNETEATAKYSGKVIMVTGEVVRVKVDGTRTNITLAAENSMTGGINCSFNEVVKEISEGEVITIKGRCQGMLLDVVLNNCFKAQPQ